MPTLPLSQLVPGITPDPYETLVYSARSDRPGIAPYRVDLSCYHGNGKCSCWNFVKKEKKLAAGALPSQGLMCKHLLRAHLYASYQLINAVITQKEKAANANRHHHRQMGQAQAAQSPMDDHGQPKGQTLPPAGRAARQAQAHAKGTPPKSTPDPW